MNKGSMVEEFNIDAELQSIADKLTEDGLNYGGSLFERDSSGEEFVVTVTKSNFMHELKDTNQKLFGILKAVVDDIDCYGEMLPNRLQIIKQIISEERDHDY